VQRRRLLIDLAAVVWAALWILLAVQVAVEVRGLRDLSSTVKKTGAAVREAGVTLERLESVPVVGSELQRPAERVRAAGESAVRSGEASRASIRNLSILLAIAIGVIPTAAMLGVYLHLRGVPARRVERPARQRSRRHQVVR
jgi:hypothetical protein